MNSLAMAQAALDEQTRANERLIAAAQSQIPSMGVTSTQYAAALMVAFNPGSRPEADVLLAKDAYVRGEIEIEEFERRVGAALLI